MTSSTVLKRMWPRFIAVIDQEVAGIHRLQARGFSPVWAAVVLVLTCYATGAVWLTFASPSWFVMYMAPPEYMFMTPFIGSIVVALASYAASVWLLSLFATTVVRACLRERPVHALMQTAWQSLCNIAGWTGTISVAILLAGLLALLSGMTPQFSSGGSVGSVPNMLAKAQLAASFLVLGVVAVVEAVRTTHRRLDVLPPVLRWAAAAAVPAASAAMVMNWQPLPSFAQRLLELWIANGLSGLSREETITILSAQLPHASWVAALPVIAICLVIAMVATRIQRKKRESTSVGCDRIPA